MASAGVSGGEVRTPVGNAPVIPVLLILAGGYVAWYGIHYWRRDIKYPTDPVKSVLQGKGVPDPGPAPAAWADVLQQDIASVTDQSAAAAGPGGPVLGSYSHAQLVTLWTSNGGDNSKADTAAAIAQAESSGQPKVTSSNPDGGTNVGLWQLDTKGKGAGYTVAQLQDPNTNAHVTIMGSRNGTDWSAWATYGSGAYSKFLSGGRGPQQ